MLRHKLLGKVSGVYYNGLGLGFSNPKPSTRIPTPHTGGMATTMTAIIVRLPRSSLAKMSVTVHTRTDCYEDSGYQNDVGRPCCCDHPGYTVYMTVLMRVLMIMLNGIKHGLEFLT